MKPKATVAQVVGKGAVVALGKMRINVNGA